MSDLDARLLAAHEQSDVAVLVALYREAADVAKDEETRGFYLTHAYIFALELGHPDAPCLRARLVEMGRETPL
ncbi:hypothetical protein [uncultured Tateyamaria sp.]|uniref:hypothetical protein n=1 Tax=uncultured Tateyamaria sp. TaxID=455651 RepID=UPI0026153057|nr:hypothetical protein [uncultured Tateyamaria sp.]